MPMVALIAVVVIAGCGAAIWVASRSRQQSTPQPRRYVQQPDQVTPDSFGAYSAWPAAALIDTDSDPVATLSNTPYPETAARDDRPVGQDNACRVEPNESFNFNVERDDPPSFDVERDDSCSTDSGSDSSSDSSSSD